MSRNIKEIGKELMGKSLNSFHRRTGLTQLEKNNEMQDGILDGILSQVDDAYIEKTEQSNVIHLDGSGDGVVVVDSIEGNTMVNLFNKYNYKGVLPNLYYNMGTSQLEVKNGLTYTCITNTNVSYHLKYHSGNEMCLVFNQGYSIGKFTAKKDSKMMMIATESSGDYNVDVLLIEGDWTNREIPQYFGGLQSSFEDKANDEGKHEIEILSHNINHFDNNKISLDKLSGWRTPTTITYSDGIIRANNGSDTDRNCSVNIRIPTIYLTPKVKKVYISCMARVTTGTCNLGYSYVMNSKGGLNAGTGNVGDDIVTTTWKRITKVSTLVTGMMQNQYLYTMFGTQNLPTNATLEIKDIIVSYVEPKEFIPLKQNKIKLLINEPLRAVGDIKDVLCIKDNRLMVERKLKQRTINGTESWSSTGSPSGGTITYSAIVISDMKCNNNINNLLCDKFPTVKGNQYSYTQEMLYTWQSNNGIYLHITTSKLPSNNLSGFKTYLQNNNFKFVYELKEPVYEEVLNEYGEPIILEGYENGTIYIDSTIVPTTTVRYTPKMESFKTLKEVNNNNIMLTNDVNDNIIPYMMDVDLMIMEKEMALMSHKNIRTIGVKDMTSMQKRTQDMLERLIKGKTLTEQECKTRVVTYLDAGKITDAQADELMLLISEVYA